MNKCPFCNAEIQENASFCLYCMSSLDEKNIIQNKKNKRWLIILAAFLSLFFIAVITIIALPERQTVNSTEPSSLSDTIANEKTSEVYSSDVVEKNEEVSPATNSMNYDESSVENAPETQEKTEATKNNNETVKTNSLDNSTGAVSIDNNKNNETNATKNTVKATENKDSTKATEKPTTKPTVASQDKVIYLYRQAGYGDDYSVSYTFPDNAIVITGVAGVSNNGIYVIPETIDNKPVVAVMGLAFCDSKISSTVKKVVVPASVKTIWDNAFANCYNLTDIYFCGNAIYTDSGAFPDVSKRNGSLTIHCSYNCSDRNFRYYRNKADIYDAEYKEWNGGAYN